MRKMMVLFCFVALGMVLSGCSTFESMRGLKQVKAKFKPEKRKMLIIPFSDPAYSYFQSAEGTELSRDLGEYIQREKITEVMYDTYFPRGTTEAARKKLDEGNEIEAWKVLAKEMGFDLVVVGQIETYKAGSSPGMNVASGLVEIQVQIYDMTKDGARVWQLGSTSATYPDGWEYADLPSGDIPPKQLRIRLLNRAAETIGRCFHDHLEPISGG
jgi:hypothetical protein